MRGKIKNDVLLEESKKLRLIWNKSTFESIQKWIIGENFIFINFIHLQNDDVIFKSSACSRDIHLPRMLNKTIKASSSIFRMWNEAQGGKIVEKEIQLRNKWTNFLRPSVFFCRIRSADYGLAKKKNKIKRMADGPRIIIMRFKENKRITIIFKNQ